jgi:hypothetical protein
MTLIRISTEGGQVVANGIETPNGEAVISLLDGRFKSLDELVQSLDGKTLRVETKESNE